MAPRLPQWDMPFRFERMRSGRQIVPVVEQESGRSIGNAIELILRTEQGQRRTLPEFGRPPGITFMTDRELIRSMLQQAVDDSERRARTLIQRRDIDWEDPGMQRILALYDMAITEGYDEP
jgi:hypothetical protein